MAWARLKLPKAEIKLTEVFDIMGVNPEWFIDDRSLELVQMYLYHRHNPSLAFPGNFGDTPHVWVESKILLDSVLAQVLI